MSIILLLILITYQTVASVMDMCDIKKRKGIDITEKIYFLFVSLTAGICEEIHLRGCLMVLLRDILPDLHIAVIGVGASLLFGVFHCYQGLSGIIKTSILGVLFVAIYFVTDSLVPGIVLHFLFDFSSAFLVREEIKV